MDYLLYGLLGLVSVLVALLMIAVIRTLFLKAPKSSTINLKIDDKMKRVYAEGLAQLIQFKTIASKTKQDQSVFTQMQSKMKELFPHVFATWTSKSLKVDPF